MIEKRRTTDFAPDMGRRGGYPGASTAKEHNTPSTMPLTYRETVKNETATQLAERAANGAELRIVSSYGVNKGGTDYA